MIITIYDNFSIRIKSLAKCYFLEYYSCIISILLKRGLYHMTENRNHGFRIRFYFGLILIIAACVIGFFNFQKPDAKKIYEDGKALPFSSSNDDKESALKITDISKEPVLKID